ncbi:hypothetical protein DFH28DRAFT_922584 [Melampsora americana]|nr:hypothetical protein DFH28DRAFT_922584 [Melampsora americana]
MTNTCFFSSQDLSKIRWVLKKTQIPPWLNRPSPIFGDAAAGKVRSADWITFFTIFMPFAIVELDWTNKRDLVDSWYHLAMLTEIAMDYTTDRQKIQRYLFHLTSYQSNIAHFYPNLNPTPNHHMAYHLPRQLETFGPANFLASWHFEQINGILQKCPTNNKLAELDFTLLKHAGRASNLGVLLESSQLPPLVAKIAPMLTQKKKLRSLIGDFNEEQQDQRRIVDDTFLATFKTNFKIPPYLYIKLINLLQSTENADSRTRYISEYQQRESLSRHEVPVPTLAKSMHRFKHLGLTYTDSIDNGSSSIEYLLSSDKSKTYFGKIHKMFQVLLRLHTGKYKLLSFCCVQRLEGLSPLDRIKNPYQSLCPDLNVSVFYAPSTLPEEDKLQYCDLIPSNNILYHSATFEHDNTKFNTEHNLIAVKSLSRNRAANEGKFV